MHPITSHRNSQVKYLRSLRLRKYREREGRFLIEGIRVVAEAQACGAAMETLVYAPDLLVSERAQALVETLEPERRLVLSGDVFRSLSDREQPQGIAAVVRMEDLSLSELGASPHPEGQPLLVVVAYQLQDPGNLGSIIRTADAAGATGVIVVEPSADLYAPQTVRASMGSIFGLPIVRLSSGEALPPWYQEVRGRDQDLLVVASSARAQQAHYDLDFHRPLVLLVGNERRGLPAPVREEADALVCLPMAGRATSLNASAAAAALIYEVVRQRRTQAASAG